MSSAPRLLAGPPVGAGAESGSSHVARLGHMPRPDHSLITTLAGSGLLGRGGAAFPVSTKWAAVADRADGDARLLVNGAEGEPLSAKDRLLMAARPHLVIDGALLAAGTVGASEICLYVNSTYVDAHGSLRRALRERGRLPVPVRLLPAPDAYVAGEESAAVHFVNEADARPTLTPPRPYERGIAGRPTLVQNVETLAQVALIARYGDDWYRELGRGGTKGTALVTVSGNGTGGVHEIEMGTRVGELVASGPAQVHRTGAVLLGGYFGRWVAREDAWGLPLDPVALRAAGATMGAGVVSFLSADRCGVAATAQVMEYMAGQSAAQCGPCVFGLRAIADTTLALAANRAAAADVDRLDRWAGQIAGRGACRHPDGAVGLLASAMVVFGRDFALHSRRGGCTAGATLRAAA